MTASDERDLEEPGALRSFQSRFPPEFLRDYQAGALRYTYRGRNCQKGPIDLALYTKLIHDEKPGSIIEIGTYLGGSAMFFRDTCRIAGLPTRIVTCDLHRPDNAGERPGDEDITFLKVDGENIADSALHGLLNELPRPWLVIEDSAHTMPVCLAVLHYFADRLERGELLVMEDGILDELGMSEAYQGGPNEAIRRFFSERPDVFSIDTAYADFFGTNATYAPNAWLRRR